MFFNLGGVLLLLLYLLVLANCEADLARLRVEADVAMQQGKYGNALKFLNQLLSHSEYESVTASRRIKDRHKRAMLYLNHLTEPSRAVDDWTYAVEHMTCGSAKQGEDCDKQLKKYLYYRGRTLLKMCSCQKALADFTDAQSIAAPLSQDSKIEELLNKAAECVSLKKRLLDDLWHGEFKEDCLHKGMTEALPQMGALIDDICPFSLKLNRIAARCLIERSLLAVGTEAAEDKFQDASKYAAKLLKVTNSNDLTALLIRGLALFHMGYDSEALNHFKAGLRSDPDNADHRRQFRALKRLSAMSESLQSEVSARKWDDALQTAERLLETGGVPDVLQNATEVEETEDSTEALSPLKQFRLSAIHLQRIAVARCQSALKSLKFRSNSGRLKVCSFAVESTSGKRRDDALHASALWFRGEVHLRMKAWESAVRDLDNALKAATDKNMKRKLEEKLRNARFELKKASRKDYYAILGLDPRVANSERDIKKGFRKCGLEHHPDVVGSDASEEQRAAHESQFKDCVEANDILGDAQLKAKYDRGEDVLEQMENRGRQGAGGFPFSFFQQGAGGQGGGGRRTFHFRQGGGGGFGF